ncbi:stimulator of interferon genes protein [Bufo gargarizans]|uniref:stimulator of interferon genes protein n=1 Tax=Bufo gargarizans TaxID=30331 RepID=UPI001CF16BC9|nr:stimulator of interferon genes protein [Bufo gargarizans]
MAHTVRNNSERSSIIPQPRGNRAVKAAYFFILVCALLLCLLGIGNCKRSQIAFAIAFHCVIAQSWHFMVSLCEFTEELAHVHSRYNGEYLKALQASVSARSTSLMILNVMCCYILYTEDPLPGMIHVVLLFLCNLLCRCFGLQEPTQAVISEITEKKQLNVAHGLAWSYYVGYLKLVLPVFKDKVEKFNEENNNLLRSPETMKLYILMPLSCKIYNDLKTEDENITFIKEIPPLLMDRAGIKQRVFKNNVYRILDEDHRPYYCIAEYATPLASLYEMSNITSAGFSKQDRTEQAKLLYRTLNDILESSPECQNTFRLVIYDDCPRIEDHQEHPLSQIILKHIKQQHSEEYDLEFRTLRSE